MRIIVIYSYVLFFLFSQKAVSKSQCEVEVFAILAYFVQTVICVSYRTTIYGTVSRNTAITLRASRRTNGECEIKKVEFRRLIFSSSWMINKNCWRNNEERRKISNKNGKLKKITYFVESTTEFSCILMFLRQPDFSRFSSRKNLQWEDSKKDSNKILNK